MQFGWKFEWNFCKIKSGPQRTWCDIAGYNMHSSYIQTYFRKLGTTQCLTCVETKIPNHSYADCTDSSGRGIQLNNTNGSAMGNQSNIAVCSDVATGQENNGMSGLGVTKPIFSVPLFSTFSVIVKTNVSYWISRLYLAGVAAAQLRWHLSNMNVIQGI